VHEDESMVVVLIVLTCYGGGAGTIPAFAADYFGARNVGPIYGLLMTALGFSSAFGPLLMASMRQMSGDYRGALHVIAGVMAVSLVLPLVVAPPPGDQRQALSPTVEPTAGPRSESATAVVSGNNAAQTAERNYAKLGINSRFLLGSQTHKRTPKLSASCFRETARLQAVV
jgi:Major Facilitator Superfamily